jgi:hypothetical protein
VAVAVFGESGGAGAVLAAVEHTPVDQGVKEARQLQQGRVRAVRLRHGQVGEGRRHLGGMQDHVVTGAGRVEGAQHPEVGEAVLRGDVAEQSHPIVEPEVVEPERRRAGMRHPVLLVLCGSHRIGRL